MTSRNIAAALGLGLLLALTGCTLTSSGGSGSITAPDTATDTGPETTTEGSAIDKAIADGMPELPLVACEKLLDYTSEHNATSAKWVFKYSCAETSAYEQTVTGLEQVEASDHIVDESHGSDGYLSDQDMFYIQLAEQDELDVSVAITGFEGDYEAKYTIIFRQN
jgi:hypothetical protein